MTGSLIVVPYDPQWPEVFEALALTLAEALTSVDVLSIEHVGSTSVPGLAAKPVIDIDIVVEKDNVAAAIAALATIGYAHLGDLGVPLREAFTAPADAPRHNLYVTVAGSLSLRNHIGLRDTLRARADLRDEYGAVKLSLASNTDDIDVYVDGKTDVVMKILRAAGIDEDELAGLDSLNRLPTQEDVE